jgi:hypothetical protein
LWNTFDIIQSIHSNDNFLSLEFLFQFRNAGFTFRFLQLLGLASRNKNKNKAKGEGVGERGQAKGGGYVSELFRIDPDRNGPDIDCPAFVLYGIGHGR